jgi:hypothetical protein
MMPAYFTQFAAACKGGGFLGFPTWYHYLPSNTVNGVCTPSIQRLGDVWLIVAAVIEILLRVAGIAAVIFVIIGAISYITSQGQPDKTAKARDTITNALIGLAIAVIAASLVAFIAGHVS